MHSPGQSEYDSSVEFLWLLRQEQLGLAEEAGKLWLDLGAGQTGDETQGCALNAARW